MPGLLELAARDEALLAPRTVDWSKNGDSDAATGAELLGGPED